MDQDVSQSWEDFLNPAVTKPLLIAASIYIAGFESLKNSILERPRNFFWSGWDAQTGDKIDPKYASTVLSRNKSPVYASLDWFKELGAIDDSDIATFNRVKICRNTLSHRLLRALAGQGLPDDYAQCFADMLALLRKIEVWWWVNVELPLNPDSDGTEDIDESGIIPLPILSMQLLMDIALGDEEKSKSWYEAFRKHARTHGSTPAES